MDPIFGLPVEPSASQRVRERVERVADVEQAHEVALAEDEHWRIVEYETLQAEHIAAAGWPDWDEYR